jgi:hypothetical protein
MNADLVIELRRDDFKHAFIRYFNGLTKAKQLQTPTTDIEVIRREALNEIIDEVQTLALK